MNIADGVEECDAATKEERVAFLRVFVAHTSQAISGFKCCLGQFDQMMSQAVEDKKRNRAQLEKHTRREEFMRASNELNIAGCTGSATCPLYLDWSYKTAAKWLVDLERYRREELWLKEESEEEEVENDGDEESDFENV